MQQKRVGILDSGVGGLTIFREVAKTCPEASLLYLCDNANLPYGPKSESEVLRCVDHVVSRVLKSYPLDILVVACNTMSTVALPHLRQRLPFPIVGVVPAIKPAAALSRTKKIGLLATPGTVTRAYTDTLIAEHAGNCKVRKLGSSLLVDLAEKKVRGHSIDIALIQREIAPLFENEGKEIDTVVLGCTHFPLLQEELKLAAPCGVQWVDSIQAIGKRVRELIPVEPNKNSSDFQAAFTSLDDSTVSLTPFLRELQITKLVKI